MTGATTVRLVRNWGRIGTNGQELVEVFTNEIEAGEALEALARVKRRRDIGTCEWAVVLKGFRRPTFCPQNVL
jgi:WGR domain